MWTQKTSDVEILAIRKGWQNGLTLSQTFKRIVGRMPNIAVNKVIAEWRELRKRFGCQSLPVSVVCGWQERPIQLTDRELSANVGGMTYGDWKGITGPGKKLREILSDSQK